MRLLALVPPSMRSVVNSAAAPGSDSVTHALTFVEFIRALESEPWSAVIVNPDVVSAASFAELRDSLVKLKASILLLGPLTSVGEHFAAAAENDFVLEVLCTEREFDPKLLALKLAAMEEMTANGRLLLRIAPKLDDVTPNSVPGIMSVRWLEKVKVYRASASAQTRVA